MRRGTIIIISLLVIAALLDYLSCQGMIGKEKLYKNYYENGQLQTERYYPKALELSIKQDVEINNFHKIRLRNKHSSLIYSYPLTSESGDHKFDLWDELEGGDCMLEILDNFGELYIKPIHVNYNQTLSYDDLMEKFYPKFRSIITNDFNSSNILKINVTQNDTSNVGFNIKLYRDSTMALMLDLVYKTDASQRLKTITTFKCDQELIGDLMKMERVLAFDTKDVKKNVPHEIIEFIVNTRQVYKIPISSEQPFSQLFIKAIHQASTENSTREIRLY